MANVGTSNRGRERGWEPGFVVARAGEQRISFQDRWDDLNKTLHEIGVKGRSSLVLNVGDRLLYGPGLAIGTIRSKCIPYIDDCKDACGKGNLLALETAGIST